MSEKNKEYERASALAAEKRYDEAIDLYRELIASNPQEDSLRLALAWACRDSGRLEEAVSIFSRLFEKELARKVFTGFAFDELVRIFTDQGDFPRLIEICRKAVSVQPDDVGLLFTLGEAYLKGGLPLEAADVFRKLCEMEPDATAYLAALGNALIAARDFDRAEEAYGKAVSLDPEAVDEYYYRIGNAYLETNVFERAQSYFTKAVRHRSDRTIYYCALGEAYLMQGKMEEAETAYDHAIRTDPGRRAGYYNRFGNILARQGLHAEAVRVFRKAIEADSKNPFLYLHLAQAYLALDMVKEAEEAFRAATTLGEES